MDWNEVYFSLCDFFPFVISKMLNKVVQMKNINGTSKICDFLNNINFDRLRITLNERKLCFKLKNRCLACCFGNLHR